MRRLGLALLLGGVLAVPAAAPAQDNAAPQTPEDYVCAFTGECADQAPDPAVPETSSLPGHPRISATRGFALSRTTPEAPPPRAARPAPRTTARAAPRVVAHVAGPPAAASGQRVNLRLSFESGSARLTPDALAQAGVFARALLLPQLVTMHFRIEGHTDSVGGRAMNLDLSQRRAQTVADFLVSQGIARERLDVRGFGFDQPLPGTRTSAGENRRVEAVRTS
jgi:OmpA-OmpF porin, OOP family